MVQHGLSFAEATQHFSLLTVGDGLAAQIPALLISVATGIIVTRAASDRDLGSDIAGQILSQRKAPLVAAAAIGVFALIPGLPKLPFLFIAGDLRRDRAGRCATACRAPRSRTRPPTRRRRCRRRRASRSREVGRRRARARDRLRPRAARRRAAVRAASLLRRVSMIRRQIASELGIVIPPVRIHDELGMESHEYVHQGARLGGDARAHHARATCWRWTPATRSGRCSGIPTREPAFGLEAVWVHESGRAEAESLGYTVVDAESVIVTHLTETIRSHAAELLTPPGRARAARPAQGDERRGRRGGRARRRSRSARSSACCSRCSPRASRSATSGTIVEAIGDKARTTRDTSLLSEYARQALGRAITAPHLDEQLRLQAITLDPAIEQEVSTSITQTTDGEYLAMEPPRAQAIVDRAARPGRARDGARRAARCCCARRASAATCAG